MRKKIKYTDEPMEFRVVDDSLPPPEQLAQKENNVRVMITLSKASVGFFKRHAKRTYGHYQAMIRRILDITWPVIRSPDNVAGHACSPRGEAAGRQI